MIKSLKVENFAIVETMELAFGSGLNMLSGETGAGKSMAPASRAWAPWV